MGLLDDLKGLSSSISSFSSSLHNLISIKQQITRQQATIELEKKMNEIIQRQFRDIDDPAKITQDTYKQALAEYDNLKQRILETYSAPFEKPVAQDVINQYDKSFVNNFAAAYYEKYAQGLRNDYLTLVNAKLNLIKDDVSFADFLNTINDKKFHSVLAPEDLAKMKQLERQAKGTFMFNKAIQAGIKGEEAAALISSGADIGGYKLETAEEQAEFISNVWPNLKQKTLDGFKTTYDDLQQRFNKKEISWNEFKDAVIKLTETQEKLGIINNDFEYTVRNAGFRALMANVDVLKFWGEKVVPILGDSPSYSVSADAVAKALEIIKLKRDEYASGGYQEAVEELDEYAKYVRSLGSNDFDGWAETEKKVMRLIYLEYQARFQNYNAIGEIEAMAMNPDEDMEVRQKAIQILSKIRSDTLLDQEKVPSYSIMWSTILQDKEFAKKYSDIVEDARRGDARAQSIVAIVNNNMEKAVFEYAKKNYPKYTDEAGKQITTETVPAILMNIKDIISAYEKGQTGVTGTVKLFDNTGASIRSIVDIPENKAVDFVSINKPGLESASITVRNAIIELANSRPDVVNGEYVGVVDSKTKEKRLLYVTKSGEVYEIKPDGMAAKAERIINPKDTAIPALNNLLRNNNKGLPKEIKIDIIPITKVSNEAIMSYSPGEEYTANKGFAVYRTNYDNVYMYDNMSKIGAPGKIFRVFVENPGPKGKIIKIVDITKGL